MPTAKDRAREFSADLYSSGTILFCKFCDVSLDLKLSTIKDHLKGKRHCEKKEKSLNTDGQPSKRQKTLYQPSSKLREEFVTDFTRACLEANISMNQAEKLRPFLKKNCSNGGAVPDATNLRRTWVPKVDEEKRSEIDQRVQEAVKQKWTVSLNVDESIDRENRHVVNIMIYFLGELYLLDSIFCENPLDGTSLAQLVNRSVQKFNLENVFYYYVTDNAEYCRKSYSFLLSLYPKLKWIPCACHFIDLAADTWQTFFECTTKFLNLTRMLFKRKTGAARISRWVRHLQANGVEKSLPPTPGFTRWNSWAAAARYWNTYVRFLPSFLRKEDEQTGAAYLDELNDIVQIEKSFLHLQIELAFINENCSRFERAILFFETTNQIITHRAYAVLTDLKEWLKQNSRSFQFSPALTELFVNLSEREKTSWIRSFQSAFSNAYEKLHKHMEKHTAMDILNQVRCFDPKQMLTLDTDLCNYSSLRGLEYAEIHVLEEWRSYLRLIHRDIHPHNGYDGAELIRWWQSHTDELPTLAKISMDNLHILLSSAAVERSFSHYKNILSDRRTSLSEKSLSTHLFVLLNK